MSIRGACQTAFVVAMILVPAPDGTFAQDTSVPSPQEFADRAAYANRFELEAAKLALRKGVSADVKNYARDMLRDHAEAAKNMEKAAAQQSIKLPSQLDKQYAEKLTALDAAVGGQFDPAYMSSQASVHEEAVALFELYAKEGDKGPLRNFAEQNFPSLRMHLIRIQSATNP